MKTRLLFTFLIGFLSFSLFSQTSIGIIGSATGGWDNDIDMTRDAVDTNLWTLEFDLQPDINGDADLKFRADNEWTLSWGGSGFPAGVAITDNGPNIPIRVPGVYKIQFNSSTGVYYLEAGTEVGIIGSATPLDWAQDIDMFQDSTDINKFSVTLDLKAEGECKFRLMNDWPNNWGGTDFPTGTGEFGSNDNIKIPFDGEYKITFDTLTKEYSFVETNPYKVISIIGDAALGWDDDVDMVRSTENPSQWSIIYDLSAGPIKFRANNDWALNWGGTDFPSGTAVSNGSDNIPVDPAGKYNITFDLEDLSYEFSLVEDYSSISIAGTASGDFSTFFDMERVDPTGYDYTYRTDLMDGELIFVANQDNGIFWGGGDFPSGTAERDGATVPVTAGEYVITFNYVTGAYNFKEIFEYDTMSLVGKSGPFGEWPADGDGGAKDTYLAKDATDGNLWTGSDIVLSTSEGVDDAGIKFRANTAWTFNWGSADFPTGVGTPGGANISAIAGTYNVAFNSGNGEYAFTPSTSTENILTPADILLYPNPAQNTVTIEMDFSVIKGNVTVNVIDATGKVVLSQNQYNNGQITINTSSLTTGNYFVKINSDNLFVGKNLSIIK